MTRRIGDVLHIAEEAAAECELCGKMAELRPYGPKKESVCFDCGMKDKKAAERAMAERLDGVGPVTAPADAVARLRRS